MNKFIIALMFLPVILAAQNDTTYTFKNKNGREMLPEAGDWSIGSNTVNIFKYVNTMFSKKQDEYFSYGTDYPLLWEPSFFVKYQKTSSQAYLIGVSLYHDHYVNAVHFTGLIIDSVFTDKEIVNQTNFTLSVGKEFRRGSRRIQGIYGYYIKIGNDGKSEIIYDYGNKMSVLNPYPYTKIQQKDPFETGDRLLYQRQKGGIFLGATAFLGFECFIMPKFSLVGKIFYSANYSKSGKTTYSSEQWNSYTVKREIIDLTVESDASFYLNFNENASGAFELRYYF